MNAPIPAMANLALHPGPPEQAIAPWLQLLSQLCPPTSVILVGAGTGTGPWVQTLQTLSIASATLVEADDTQFEHLQRNLQAHPAWRLRKQVVSAQAGQASFHQASHTAESGLLAPESLRSLWPNLKTLHKQTRQAVALSHIQAETDTQAAPANWLLIDCLPALPILQGANQLARFDVVAMRVVLGTSDLASSEATASQAQDTLQANGFRCIAIETSRHPALGHALFVRDTAAQASQLQQQLAQHTQAAQAQAQTIVLAQAAAQQAEAAKAAVEAAAAAAAKTAAEEAQAAKAATVAAAAHAAAASQQAEERAAQVQQLNQAKAAAEKLVEERDQLIVQLQTDLKTTQEALAKEKQAKDIEVKAKEQTLVQLKAVEDKSTELINSKNLLVCNVQVLASKDRLAFNTKSEHVYKNDAGDIKVSLPTDKPAYLVSNQDGNFDAAPGRPQLKLEPGKAYELSGSISFVGDVRPVIWLFEYDGNGKKLQSHTYPTKDGCLKVIFRTDDAASSFAIAIRLGGSGDLNPAETSFKFQHSLAIEVAETLKHENGDLDKRLNEMQVSLQKQQQIQGQKNLSQIESFLRLQHYLGNQIVLPDMHGWPISPDFGVLLIRLLEATDYDAVIEFGSGVSTMLIALALQKKKQKNPSVSTAFVSFEHLDEYHHKTTNLLVQSQLRSGVSLVLAPLVETSGVNQLVSRYYDCSETLSGLKELLGSKQARILAVVDGPPAATGPFARYPALASIENAFGGLAEIDYLMDDYVRQDEREIVALWEAQLKEAGRSYSRDEFLSLEKQACMLKVKAMQS